MLLPAVPGSKRFPDKEVMAIIYIMVIVARPSGQNIADDDPRRLWSHMLDGSLGSTHRESTAAVPQDVRQME